MGLFGRKKRQMEELAAATYVCDACGREVPLMDNCVCFKPEKHVCNECVNAMHFWINPYIPYDIDHSVEFVTRDRPRAFHWSYAVRHKAECEAIIQKYTHQPIVDFKDIEQIKSEMAQCTTTSVITKDFTIVCGDGKYIENSKIYAITYDVRSKLDGAPYVFVFFTHDEELPFFFTTVQTHTIFGKDKKLERYIQLYLEYFYKDLDYPILKVDKLIDKIRKEGNGSAGEKEFIEQLRAFSFSKNEFKDEIVEEYLGFSNPRPALDIVTKMGYVYFVDMRKTYSFYQESPEVEKDMKANPQRWFFESLL